MALLNQRSGPVAPQPPAALRGDPEGPVPLRVGLRRELATAADEWTERVKKLEEKTAWKSALDKAEGVKVKDDAG